MQMLKLCVKGKLGVTLKFNKINILLGGNKTGKSTFLKLMLYALGTHIDNFIPEIIKQERCQQVELDLQFNNRKMIRVVRRLPSSDTVFVIPLNLKGEPVDEELEVFSLDEYSDFLLVNEGYNTPKISYGTDKTATLRYYFLLRAVVADQDTNAGNILASLGGSGKDYLNSQSGIKKAIIEEIIQKENYLILEKRFGIQNLQEKRKASSAKRSTIQEIIDIELGKNPELTKDKDKLAKRLEAIFQEKESLTATHMKNIVNLKNVNDGIFENETAQDKKEYEIIKGKITDIILGKQDIITAIDSIKKEISSFKKMIAARQVFTHIPVEKCPICLEAVNLEHEESGKCPFCKKMIESNKIDNISLYKKMLDESLVEATKLQNEMNADLSQLVKEKQRLEQNIAEKQFKYLEGLKAIKTPIEEIINSIKIRVEKLSNEASILENLVTLLNYYHSYGEELSTIEVDLKNARKELAELETLSGKNDRGNLSLWQQSFFDILQYVFHDISSASLDSDYMPVVDNIEAKLLSSASQKVATRLAYILSLFQLKDLENASVNHPGFVFFDSPKDKDLDTDKYERFLKLASKSGSGQIFITGSITEKQSYKGLFADEDFLEELSEQCKLLQPSDS